MASRQRKRRDRITRLKTKSPEELKELLGAYCRELRVLYYAGSRAQQNRRNDLLRRLIPEIRAQIKEKEANA